MHTALKTITQMLSTSESTNVKYGIIDTLKEKPYLHDYLSGFYTQPIQMIRRTKAVILARYMERCALFLVVYRGVNLTLQNQLTVSGSIIPLKVVALSTL